MFISSVCDKICAPSRSENVVPVINHSGRLNHGICSADSVYRVIIFAESTRRQPIAPVQPGHSRLRCAWFRPSRRRMNSVHSGSQMMSINPCIVKAAAQTAHAPRMVLRHSSCCLLPCPAGVPACTCARNGQRHMLATLSPAAPSAAITASLAGLCVEAGVVPAAAVIVPATVAIVPAPAAAVPQPAPVAHGYSSDSYWNDRYSGSPTHFDWFFTHAALAPLLREACSPDAGPCLHVGCGNSNLSDGMARSGYQARKKIEIRMGACMPAALHPL